MLNFRAYLAVIKDSFREALASYVLWMLLGIISIVLLLLAPVGIQPHLTTKFVPGEIQDLRQLTRDLQTASQASEPNPGQRVWQRIDEEARVALVRFSAGDQRGGRAYFEMAEKLCEQLNQLVVSDDLFDEQVWRRESLPKEARDLLDRPRKELSSQERARLNRLLIEAAIRKQLIGQRGMSANLTYLSFAPAEPWPMSPHQIRDFVEKFVVTNIMSWLLGAIGVFVAILVTSPLVPWMFEPGSIQLLLSKPISRSLLFLTKFAGGCAFITISVSYLIGGLWLILGTRLGIWNHRLLWCIPVFMFLFAVYYAVASLAGLIWKNAIVSVVVTIAFFLACFTLGALKLWVAEPYFGEQRITRITPAGDDLLAVAENQALLQWSPATNAWQRIREPDRHEGVPRLEGPFWHAPSQQLVLGSGAQGIFGLGGSDLQLKLGRGDDGWRMYNGPDLPRGTAAILWEPNGTMLVVAADGVFRLDGELSRSAEPIKIFGLPLPLGKRESFRLVSRPEDSVEWQTPLVAALSEDNLFVVSGIRVQRFVREPTGQYRLAAAAKLAGNERDGSLVAAGGGFLLIAREDGKIVLLRGDDLESVRDEQPEPFSQPRFVAQSPNGKWIALLFQNRRLWLLETDSGRLQPARVRGQEDISAATFDANNRLWIADRIDRVSVVDPRSWIADKTLSPQLGPTGWLNQYLLTPLYRIFPKPGELDFTVQYVLTGKSTAELEVFRGLIGLPKKQRDPWKPVWSSALFMLLTLGAACVFIERSEF